MSVHDRDEKVHQTPPAVEYISQSPQHEHPKFEQEQPPPVPKYGSKSYWDERYQKQFMLLAEPIPSTKVPISERQQQQQDDTISSKKEDENNRIESCNDVTTLPYHSWYFTYDELRPIILPLLLGETDCQDVLLDQNEKCDIDIEADNGRNDPEIGSMERDEILLEGTKHDDENIGDDDEGEEEEEKEEVGDESDDEECGNDDGEWEEVADADEVEDDDDDSVPARDGLAKDGPVSVLEVGCGDVPLGVGLAFEFRHLTTTLLQTATTTASVSDDNIENGPTCTGSNLSIISKIICTDYSPIAVDMMTRQYCTTESDINTENVQALDGNVVKTPDGSTSVDKRSLAPLQFEVVDARKLPYTDNSFHMVLEKGTLDAVLSDTVKGIVDCVQIVSECARVTRGCIIIVSHLNAHTPNGLGWLEEVVMEGLKKYSVRPTSDVVSWDIEVHGNAEVVDEEDENATKSSNSFPGGPAVYVIHKIMKGNTVKESIEIHSPSMEQQSVVATSIVTDNGNAVKPSDDDDENLDIVPINVRFFSY